MNKEFLKPLALLLAVYTMAVSLFKCEAEKQEVEEEGTQKETIELIIEENLKEKIEQEYKKGETDYKFYFEEERESLEINLLNNVRFIVHKTEKGGRKDMVELLNHAIYEEGWVYLSEKELWIEIGKNERVKCDTEKYIFESGFEQDLEYLDYLFVTNKKLVHYHIHPNPLNLQKILIDLNSTQGKEHIEQNRKKLSLIWVPSVDDLYNFGYLSSKFYAKNNKDGILEDEYSLAFRIISNYGMCQMTFKEKARKDNNYLYNILNEKLETQESLDNYIKELIEKDEPNIEERICNHLSDQYFKFEFIPPQ